MLCARFIIHSSALVASMILVGCSLGTPSTGLIRKNYEDISTKNFGGAFKVTSVEKIDGQSGEVFGVKVYSMHFRLKGVFVRDFRVDSKGKLIMPVGAHLENYKGLRWIIHAGGPGEYLEGDEFVIETERTFEKRESGWVLGR